MTRAVSALRSLTYGEGKENEKAPPRACWEGADDARLHDRSGGSHWIAKGNQWYRFAAGRFCERDE